MNRREFGAKLGGIAALLQGTLGQADEPTNISVQAQEGKHYLPLVQGATLQTADNTTATIHLENLTHEIEEANGMQVPHGVGVIELDQPGRLTPSVVNGPMPWRARTRKALFGSYVESVSNEELQLQRYQPTNEGSILSINGQPTFYISTILNMSKAIALTPHDHDFSSILQLTGQQKFINLAYNGKEGILRAMPLDEQGKALGDHILGDIHLPIKAEYTLDELLGEHQDATAVQITTTIPHQVSTGLGTTSDHITLAYIHNATREMHIWNAGKSVEATVTATDALGNIISSMEQTLVPGKNIIQTHYNNETFCLEVQAPGGSQLTGYAMANNTPLQAKHAAPGYVHARLSWDDIIVSEHLAASNHPREHPRETTLKERAFLQSLLSSNPEIVYNQLGKPMTSSEIKFNFDRMLDTQLDNRIKDVTVTPYSFAYARLQGNEFVVEKPGGGIEFQYFLDNSTVDPQGPGDFRISVQPIFRQSQGERFAATLETIYTGTRLFVPKEQALPPGYSDPQ